MSGAAVEERQNDVGIITGVDLVVRDVMTLVALVTELAEVAIERTVLLQHHDDVLDALQTTVGYNIHRGWSRRVLPWASVAVTGVGGILRGRNSTTLPLAALMAERLYQC